MIMGAKASLLTNLVRYPSPHLPRAAELGEHGQRLAEEYLKDKTKTLEDGGVPSVERIVTFGQPAESITDYARLHDVDLIIMSTRGIGATGKYAVGNIAMKVLTTAACPVFLAGIEEATGPA